MAGKTRGRLEGEGDRTVDAHLLFGKPDAAVVGLSDTFGAGLVVLGSRGLGGVRRALLGSVSESVVRHAGRPVLIVRKDVRKDAVGGAGGEREQAG